MEFEFVPYRILWDPVGIACLVCPYCGVFPCECNEEICDATPVQKTRK